MSEPSGFFWKIWQSFRFERHVLASFSANVTCFLLARRGISLLVQFLTSLLNSPTGSFQEAKEAFSYHNLVYTGPIDEFFDCCYGKLPYRSLEFDFQTLDVPFYQPVAVINYPNDYDFTRVTEFKHLTGQQHASTTLVYEYPRAEGDPYYPIPRPANTDLYKRYKALADATSGIHFVGRLATYSYYNMDQVVAQALTLYKQITEKETACVKDYKS